MCLFFHRKISNSLTINLLFPRFKFEIFCEDTCRDSVDLCDKRSERIVGGRGGGKSKEHDYIRVPQPGLSSHVRQKVSIKGDMLGGEALYLLQLLTGTRLVKTRFSRNAERCCKIGFFVSRHIYIYVV